ncbi:hypothetical protein B1A99_19150 [Cohnella sp. CIP 111063]|nr:hypothetical protein B1A99_19150 [Cohnella sp. CIP 111063]PRX69820.1 hypothetical protein B0G52_112179 [Cohnella sp. SGD-V74]
MLRYCYDQSAVRITESPNENDIEFHIRILLEEPLYLDGIQLIKKKYERNGVDTKVLFYANYDREYRAIVHRDHYAYFIIELMKHQLLRSVEWTT